MDCVKCDEREQQRNKRKENNAKPNTHHPLGKNSQANEVEKKLSQNAQDGDDDDEKEKRIHILYLLPRKHWTHTQCKQMRRIADVENIMRGTLPLFLYRYMKFSDFQRETATSTTTTGEYGKRERRRCSIRFRSYRDANDANDANVRIDCFWRTRASTTQFSLFIFPHFLVALKTSAMFDINVEHT